MFANSGMMVESLYRKATALVKRWTLLHVQHLSKCSAQVESVRREVHRREIFLGKCE